MLKEALDFLFSQSHKSKEARLLNVPGDGRTVYVDQDGHLTPLVIPPKPRESLVDSVDDFCNALISYGKSGNSSVWLCGEKLVAITDDSDRRDRVTLPLRKSSAYQKVLQLAGTPLATQQQLIQLLRVELTGVNGRNDLLTAVRSIKFKQSAEGHSNIQHGNESMGRIIENEVTGAGNLPEELHVTLPLYDNPGERGKQYVIDLDLEIIAADSKFRLKPLPDSLEAAQASALESIRNEVTEQLDGVRIFYGTP